MLQVQSSAPHRHPAQYHRRLHYCVEISSCEAAGAHSASRSTEGLPSRSLVICPQVLVGHWAFEIQKYVEADLLRTLAYEGTPLQRQALRSSFEKADVIIMSYETLRVDIESLHQARWLYCILDEGHLIRNPRSKVTQV